VLPGADLLVIVADVSAPIRDALDVMAELVRATGLFEPGGDTAWGLLSGVPVVVLPTQPYEALIATHIVAVPAVRARAGAVPMFRTPRAVTVSGAVVGAPRVRRFVPGRSSLVDPSVVAPMNEVRSLEAADVLLVIPDSADVRTGDTVAAVPLRGDW
jgi:molybdopterin biosynthesis enzyme